MKKLWTRSRYYIFLAVGILLVYFVFKDVNLASMWSEIKGAHFGWIGLSMFCGLLAMSSRAWRWRLLLEPLGFTPGFLNCFHGVAIGYFANIGVPRMGEVVRCTILNQTDDIPVNKLIGTVIIERVIDVLMLLTLISLIIISEFDRFGSFFWNELFSKRFDTIGQASETSKLIYAGVALLTAVLLFFAGRSTWIWLKNKAVWVKISTFLKGLGDGVITVFRMKKKGLFIAHTLFIWFNYFLMTWVCVYAYDPTSALKAMDGLVLMVVGGLGMSAPVPGGVGAFHILVEKALLLYDIKPFTDPVSGLELRPGLVFATIVHTSQFLMTLFIGSISLIIFTLQKRRTNAKKSA